MADINKQTPELVISANPHIRHPDTVPRIMADVLIALVPAFAAAVYFFGIRSFSLVFVCVVSAVGSEALCQKIRGVPLTVSDGSAALTGILLAFCCPLNLPFWMAAVGSAFAIIIAKEAFGGLGNNPFNPAHIGRAFLLASWPVAMTTWVAVKRLVNPASTAGINLWYNPFWSVDAINKAMAEANLDSVTAATPLAKLKAFMAAGASGKIEAIKFARTHLWDAFIGNIGGCIGETSALALLIGAAYLFWRGHITWHIPIPMITTVFLLTFALNSFTIAVFNLFVGGLMIGAFFMATDMVTTPVSKSGRIIFGVGCGVIVVLIRQFGAYPEGVCYSILLMNAATPIIDHYTRPKVFGTVNDYA